MLLLSLSLVVSEAFHKREVFVTATNSRLLTTDMIIVTGTCLTVT